jgi:hypothetical protein
MESLCSIAIVSVTFCLWIPFFLFASGSKTGVRHEYHRQVVIMRRFLRAFRRVQPVMSLRKTG